MQRRNASFSPVFDCDLQIYLRLNLILNFFRWLSWGVDLHGFTETIEDYSQDRTLEFICRLKFDNGHAVP